MKEHLEDILQAIRWAAAPLLAWLWGLHPVFLLFLGLVLLDWITGLLASKGEWSSETGYRGMCKKVTMGCLILAAEWVSVTVLHSIPLGPMAAGFFAANELLSITENAGKLGIAVPPVLMDAIAALKKSGREKA